MRVRDDIDKCDAVKPDHLLEVNKSGVVAVDVIDRKTEVCAIRVRFQDVAPEGRRGLGSRDMQED